MKAFVIAFMLLAIAPAATQIPLQAAQPAGGAAPAAADGKLGMALMSAVVRETGELIRGNEVTSSVRVMGGQYDVVFQRSVVDCSVNVTPAAADPFGFVVISIASAFFRADNAKKVRAEFYTPNGGDLTDTSFHLLVFCPS